MSKKEAKEKNIKLNWPSFQNGVDDPLKELLQLRVG